ncbi:MAG: LamG-like jellyroll fold domain-containing protein [Planctomycetota bacterium]
MSENVVERFVRRLATSVAITPSRLLAALMTGILIVAKLDGASTGVGCAQAEEPGLVGHWPLQGDCRDHSGHGLHGINHGVDLATGLFNGRNAYIEIPASDSLRLGTGDFTIVASVFTDEIVDDTLGDVVSLYDARRRRGVTLNLKASSGGYQSSGDDRHVYFGIDNDRLGEWRDCGRPNRTSNYVANSLTVFDGHLYAATIDAQDHADWQHVYRYAGGERWVDCGRVGPTKSTGVMALIVHGGHLYAATSTYDWTRVFSGEYEPARVYRYAGGTNWIDCGQPGEMLRINCLASFGGKLYVGGDRGLPPPGERQWTGRPYKIYVYEGGTKWGVSGSFPPEPPRSLYAHAMAVHDGRLYAGYPNVFAFDGQTWRFAGLPIGDTPIDQKPHLQVHSLEVYRGRLLAGMWPEARVVEYVDEVPGGETWRDRGKLGDGSEVNSLTVYNGQLYAGAIPRGEVSRYECDGRWKSLRKFFSPPNWEPGPPTAPVREEINNWTRVTSLTVFDGRMFASLGSCTSSVKDAPADMRGRIYSLQAGECVSYDKDLGPGWKQLMAVRTGNRLKLYIDDKLVAESPPFDSSAYQLDVDAPLLIGFGEHDYFTGRICDVRLYRRALR